MKSILVLAILGIVISGIGKNVVEGRPCTYNSDCSSNEFCKKADGNCNGGGNCAPRPFACFMIIWPPICGCDGVTYDEDKFGRCGANMAGVNVDHVGYCDECDYYLSLGDFDCDEDVDLIDFSIFALAWCTEPGDTRWNPDCDIGIPADNFIGMLDLAVLCQNWLKEPLS